MDKINRRQSTTFDSANLEAALNSIQETSGKEEVEDTGMTQDVLSICVQFPTGYLTGTYDGEQILLNTGYKTAKETQNYDLHVIAISVKHNGQDVWYAEIDSANVEVIDATDILGVSNKEQEKEQELEQLRHDNAIIRQDNASMRQTIMNMEKRFEEMMCKFMTDKEATTPPKNKQTSSFFITDRTENVAQMGKLNENTAQQEDLAFVINPMLREISALKKKQEKEQLSDSVKIEQQVKIYEEIARCAEAGLTVNEENIAKIMGELTNDVDDTHSIPKYLGALKIPKEFELKKIKEPDKIPIAAATATSATVSAPAA